MLTLVSMIVLIFVAILDDYAAKRVSDEERDSTRNVRVQYIQSHIHLCYCSPSALCNLFKYLVDVYLTMVEPLLMLCFLSSINIGR